MSIAEAAVRFRSAVPDVLQKVSSKFPTLSSARSNIQRTEIEMNKILMSQLDNSDSSDEELSADLSKKKESLPPTLDHILSAHGLNYVTKELVDHSQQDRQIPWLTLAEGLGGRAARIESLDLPVPIPHTIVDEGSPENPIRREFSIGQQSVFGSYQDSYGRLDIIWSKPYGNLKDWYEAGFTRFNIVAQIQTAKGLEETVVGVEAVDDRSQFNLSISQSNLESGDLTYEYNGTFDRDGNRLEK